MSDSSHTWNDSPAKNNRLILNILYPNLSGNFFIDWTSMFEK